MMGLLEAAMNLDADLVVPFLKRVSSSAMGFGAPEIMEILRTMNQMAIDEAREFHFVVQHQGRAVPMKIRLFKDDVDAFALSFFTAPKLAVDIDKEMSAFAEEYGS